MPMTEQKNIVKIQTEIINLFVESLTTIEEEYKLSYPFIPRISAAYLKNRIVIVGQETNTWYNDHGYYNDRFLQSTDNIEEDALEKRYDEFVNDAALNYRGKFWEFSRSLYGNDGIFNGEMVQDRGLTHCWINLFCMEACQTKNDANGRPTKNKKLRKSVLNHQGSLIYKLLHILEPKLIIFLTGHALDDEVLQYALGSDRHKAEFTKIDQQWILETKEACQITPDITSVFSKTTIIRLYHPTYFMGYINGHKKIANKLGALNIDQSVSSYYLSTVKSFLRNWGQTE